MPFLSHFVSRTMLIHSKHFNVWASRHFVHEVQHTSQIRPARHVSHQHLPRSPEQSRGSQVLLEDPEPDVVVISHQDAAVTGSHSTAAGRAKPPQAGPSLMAPPWP